MSAHTCHSLAHMSQIGVTELSKLCLELEDMGTLYAVSLKIMLLYILYYSSKQYTRVAGRSLLYLRGVLI